MDIYKYKSYTSPAMALVLGVGSNYFGQLGLGGRRRDDKRTPTPFGCSEDSFLDSSSVSDVQVGSQFTTVLSQEGKISICGTLNGVVYPTLTPVEVNCPLRCVQLACGRKHILALMDGGIVMSWGIGYFGQLGHGDDSSWDHPKVINSLEPHRLGSRVTQVACGGSHSGIVTESGRVFMWGLNKSGQCGVTAGRGDSFMDPKPLSATENGVVLRAESLVCGRNHSAILTVDCKVYVWGCSSFGRLGISGTRSTQPIPLELSFFCNIQVHSLASGDFHMLALGHDCGVYSWGYGAEGQTGHSSLFHIRNPRRLDCFDSLGIVSIACGSSYSMAISRGGYLYAWGYGDDGWLGLVPPTSMPYADPDCVEPGAILSHTHTFSFDSRHNVLVPQRVKLLSQHVVQSVRCGGAHTVFLVRARDVDGNDDVGKDGGGHDINPDSHMVVADTSVSSLSSMDAEELSLQLISWCRHKKIPLVLHAIDRGADVDTRDTSGNTPIIVAAQNGHLALCKLLRESHATINAVNARGNSALHYACAYGFDDCFNFLLSAGADDFCQNNDGLTPYEMKLAAEGEL